MSKEPLFKVVFMSQGQVYEIYARHIFQILRTSECVDHNSFDHI